MLDILLFLAIFAILVISVLVFIGLATWITITLFKFIVFVVLPVYIIVKLIQFIIRR